MPVKPFDYDDTDVASEYSRHRRVHPEVLKSLASVAEFGHASRVLEVGCGTGNYLAALESLADCTCWGVDASEPMLCAAQRQLGVSRVVLSAAESLSFPSDCFDLVFSVDVVHHLRDPRRYFREAYRSLKTGGRLCSATDSAWIIQHRRPLATYFPETVDADLGRYPPVDELREMMAEIGFADISQDVVVYSYQLADIQAYRDRAFSSLHLIPPGAFERGLARLERDMRTGPILCISRYALIWGTKRSRC